MKVLWICNFSNSEIRDKMVFSESLLDKALRRLIINPRRISDYGMWITNGIKTLKNSSTNIDLHIISPHYGLSTKLQKFKIDRVSYYFFRPNDNSILQKILRTRANTYKQNRNIINKIISDIQPDIIHFYGAENPRYSIAVKDIDAVKYPILVSLQTLMSTPAFYAKYPISKKEYVHRVKIEQCILKKVKYIGSPAKEYTDYIWQNINPNAIITDSFLFLQQEFPIINTQKKYDFVYFAAGIEKAIDIVLEVFSLVLKKHPNVLLNIIGGCSQESWENIQNRIKDLGIERNLFFSGMLLEHKDVLVKIQESRYALLPLKVDSISGTIREAMFVGLPVVTTVTDGTPLLNEKRESILLSEQNDHEAMANNMIRLIENPTDGTLLRNNALITVREMWNNNNILHKLLKVYDEIIQNQKFNKKLPYEYFMQINKTI